MAATSVGLPRDILELILTLLPTIDLIPASSVSTTWQLAVSSSLPLSPRRRYPWLMLVHHHHHPPSSTTHTFDPHSRSWHRIPLNPPSSLTLQSFAPRSSTSTSLLFHLTPAHLCFSSDPFHRTWVESPSTPSVWRRDPLLVSVGQYLVVAGGVYEFEDDPLAVEVLDVGTGHWKIAESMPEEFRCSTSSLWLSTAVVGGKVCVVERSTGLSSSFDPASGTWGEVEHMSPNSRFSLFAIAGAGDEVVAAGLSPEDDAGAAGLCLWKTKCDTAEKREIGAMPLEMAARLAKNGNGTTISTLEIRTAEAAELVYVYNPSDAREIFFCETKRDGCEWGSVPSPVAADRVPMDQLLFTCSPVEVDVLREVLAQR